MSRILAFLLLVSLAARADEPAPTAAAAVNRLALDLYARLGKEPGNLAFSPCSISSALAMTYAGARGTTAAEMARVLHYAGPDRTHPAFATLSTRLAFEKGELAIANRLWTQVGDPFLPAYLALVERHYGAGVQALDFGADLEAARKTINGWVEERTRERIRDLIRPGVLSPATTLVLTNALYFKGAWAESFSEGATRDAPFHLAADARADVPTMVRTGAVRYAKRPVAQIVELAYEGGRYAMTLVVPDAVDGLPALEKRLDAAQLERWLGSLESKAARLHLPRFEVTRSFRLADTLQAMGMREAFTARADFTGMNGRGGIFISAVEHKAFVAVDEKGTEAAAATAVVMKRGGARPELTIRVDRPFLFLIRDRETGCVLFLGRVVDPRESS